MSIHVHLPSGLSVTLTNAFKTLHQGLYYVDYIPVEEGTHVFHIVAFSQGTTSHGSAATTVLSSDVSTCPYVHIHVHPCVHVYFLKTHKEKRAT